MWTHIISGKSAGIDKHSVTVAYTRDTDGAIFEETYMAAVADPAGWPMSAIDARLKLLESFDETALDAVTVGQPLDAAVVKPKK